MPRTFLPCPGLPHDFNPQLCECDWDQYQAETAAIETNMAERSRERTRRHNEAEVKQMALPAGGK
jgi:hypothetical protein